MDASQDNASTSSPLPGDATVSPGAASGTAVGTAPGTISPPAASTAAPPPGTMTGESASGPAVPPAQPAEDLVGQVLAGRYRILQKLGEGAMGAVYLGEHVRMGRKDAIKVLRGPLSQDAEAIRRFNRGARNVSAVHHPNVCTVYDFSDTAEGITFLAMELITGESLRDLLERDGALTPERAVNLVAQVASALQAAHDAGIVHRDLKPANVMLTRNRAGDDVVKVVDFDIAKGQEEAEGSEVTRVGFVVGTPEYMSPEQLMGEKLDGRSDLYSLGLLLFRMLTGSLPFRAASTQELMVQRLTHTPLKLEEAAPGRTFPAGLQAAIDRALARQPAGRQATAGEFGHEIVAALAAPTPSTPPATAAVPPTVVAPAAAGMARLSGGTPVAEPPQPLEVAATATRAAASAVGRPRSLVPLAVAALVLLAAVGGSAAWWVMRHNGRAAAAGKAANAVETKAKNPPQSPAAPAATPDATTSGPIAAGPAASPGGSSSPTTTVAAATPKAPAVSDVTPPARPPETPRRTATLTPANARDVLFRQFDRLGPPYPPRRQLLAIRDTAQAYWNLDGVAAQQRAMAAYIIGNTYVATGEQAQIVPWLQRAVSLDPSGPGYRKQLDYYQGQGQ